MLFEMKKSIEFHLPHYKFHIRYRAKVLFKDLNSGTAMAIVVFEFSRKRYCCFDGLPERKSESGRFSKTCQLDQDQFS